MKRIRLSGRRREWLSIVIGVVLWLLTMLALGAVPFAWRMPIQIGLSLLFVLTCLILHIFYRRYFLEGILAVAGGGLSFELWLSTGRYAFVSSPDSLHFWQTSLAVSLVAVTALLIGEYWAWRHTPPFRKRTAVSLITVLCAGVVAFGQCEASLTHLNVAWDRSAPVRHMCEVEGNWKEQMGRSGTIITLLINKNGERISLSRDHIGYVEYEAGDSVCLLEYSGAFGEPYYVVEGDG